MSSFTRIVEKLRLVSLLLLQAREAWSYAKHNIIIYFQGKVVNASVWSAFAMKTDTSDVVQVTNTNGRLVLLINGIEEDISIIIQELLGNNRQILQ